MGIYFEINLVVIKEYLNDDKTVESIFEIYHSKMDLGNFRILRTILTQAEINVGGGSKIILGEDVERWLFTCIDKSGFQVELAWQHIHNLLNNLADYGSESINYKVNVRLTWG